MDSMESTESMHSMSSVTSMQFKDCMEIEANDPLKSIELMNLHRSYAWGPNKNHKKA